MCIANVRALFAALVAGCLAAPGLASPAPWRGEDRTTLARWEFSTGADPAPVDEYVGEFTAPTATILNSTSYKDSLDGRQGVWPLGGQIFVALQNYSEPLGHKGIWVQLTWEAENAGATPLVEAWVGTDRVSPVTATQISQEDLPGNWWLGTYSILLAPSPPLETVHVTHCIYVDQLIVETQSMPEPHTLVMALAGLLLRRPRR
jgi:hypothetical protein